MRQCCKAIVNNSLIQRRGSPSGYGTSVYAGRVLDGAKPAGLAAYETRLIELAPRMLRWTDLRMGFQKMV